MACKEKDYTLVPGYFDETVGGIISQDREKFVRELMMKSVLPDGFEKVPEDGTSMKKPKKTKVAPELPEDIVNDIRVLNMRSALDTKRFYKKEDFKKMSGKIQVGKVLDSPLDFYSSRLPKKVRKRTLVDELLADCDFRKNIKKRYVNIIQNRRVSGRKFKKKSKKSK